MSEMKHFSKLSQRITFSVVVLVCVGSIVIGSSVGVYSGRVLEENSYAQFKTIEQQVLKNIDDKLGVALRQFMALEINDDFIKIAKNTSDEQAVSQFSELKKLFEIYAADNSELIDSIMFYRYDDVLFTEYSYTTQVKEKNWFHNKVQNQNMRTVWASEGIKMNGTDMNVSEEYISIIKEINDIEDGYGVLVFNIEKTALQKICETIDIGKEDFRIILKDASGGVLLEEGFCEIKDAKSKGMFLNDAVQYGGFELEFFVSDQLLSKQKRMLGNFFVYCAALNFLVFFAVAYLVSGKITKPLVEFTNAIKNTKAGEYNTDFKYEHNDEIGSLVKSYNKMMKANKGLQMRIKNEREQKLVAELNSLRQQINAHFLYNTLDIIYWFSKNGEGDKAAEATVALSKMLRISVSDGKDVISVRDELMHLESYLSIQSYRFDFKYNIEAEAEMLDYNIPKLILQPMAENAIVHGFEDYECEARLEIKAYLKNEKLIFEVIDNGCGFEYEKDMKKTDKESGDMSKNSKYAINNIKTRFNLIYGKGEYMKFITAPGKGTKVIFSLPKL